MWVKSSHSESGGNCLEWRKSRFGHANGNCVEAADGIHVRDSQLGDASAVLSFTPRAWGRFTSTLK